MLIYAVSTYAVLVTIAGIVDHLYMRHRFLRRQKTSDSVLTAFMDNSYRRVGRRFVKGHGR